MADVLGEGDILELLASLDAQDTGFIDIRTLAMAINQHISEPEFQVRLETVIDEVVIGEIVERIEDEANLTFADPSKFEGIIDAPEGYQSLLLDLYCGLYLRHTGSL